MNADEVFYFFILLRQKEESRVDRRLVVVVDICRFSNSRSRKVKKTKQKRVLPQLQSEELRSPSGCALLAHVEDSTVE